MLDAAKITEKVREVMEDKDFSGVVLCKHHGQPLFQMVRGYANRSEELLNNINTRFGIASGCKLFTSCKHRSIDRRREVCVGVHIKRCLEPDLSGMGSGDYGTPIADTHFRCAGLF